MTLQRSGSYGRRTCITRGSTLLKISAGKCSIKKKPTGTPEITILRQGKRVWPEEDWRKNSSESKYSETIMLVLKADNNEMKKMKKNRSMTLREIR